MMRYVVDGTDVSSFLLLRYFSNHLPGDHVFELLHILIVSSIPQLSPFLRYLTRLGFPSIVNENARILLEWVFSPKLTSFLAEGDVLLEDVILLFLSSSKYGGFTATDSTLRNS